MLPPSRSFVMLADRLGLTGTGGGGTGDSRESNVRCRAFKVASSSFSARELDVVVMAFEVGSRRRGRDVKVSRSSIVLDGSVLSIVWCFGCLAMVDFLVGYCEIYWKVSEICLRCV